LWLKCPLSSFLTDSTSGQVNVSCWKDFVFSAFI
jgi:hypothetical protein